MPSLPVTVANQPAGRPIPDLPDALLSTTETAFLIGLAPRTLEAKRLRGGGPPFVRISARAVRYRRADVVAWVARPAWSPPPPTTGAPVARGRAHDRARRRRPGLADLCV